MPESVSDQAVLDILRRVQAKVEGKPIVAHDVEPTEVLEDAEGHDLVGVVVQTPPHSAVTGSNFLRHPDTHPLVLDLALLKKYGPTWLEWEMETLAVRIPEDFRTPSISDINLTKIQALKTLHFVDTYWEDWEIFLWCTMALNGVFPDFEIMQAPTVAQCLVSVDVANSVRDNMPWGDEIKGFVGACYQHDGILVPIEPTEFALISHDEPEGPLEEVRRKWPGVRDHGHAPSGTGMVPEQLHAMLVAEKFLEESRAHLRAQLSLVSHV